jgi:hypothetical protein
MSKRFTDTTVFRKDFIRGLQGPYKLLWFYLIAECNHAGVWDVELDVAQLRIGADSPITKEGALAAFGEKVQQIDGGKKWFIPSFVEFQYGELNEENRAHKSVLDILHGLGLNGKKPLPRGMQGRKDKDMDKDMETDTDFSAFWEAYPNKTGKQAAVKAWEKAKGRPDIAAIMAAINQQKRSEKWTKDGGQYIPNPATWINQGRWDDKPVVAPKPKNAMIPSYMIPL